jgi:hypothetical protein
VAAAVAASHAHGSALPGRAAPVPPVAVELVGRACSGLRDAGVAQDPGERYVTAHLAALRAAAAVLAVRSAPARRRRPVNVWDALATLAPELSAWSTYFAAGAARRAAVEAGRGSAVTEAEAVEHVRGAEAFTALVTEMLGTPAQQPLPLAAS